MFNSISWQEFLTTLAVAAGSYYVITALLLFSGEIKSIFTQKQSNAIDSEELEDQNDSNESIDLMGKVKYETLVNVPHENIVDTEEVKTQPPREAEEPIEAKVLSPEGLLVGSVADLLEEIKIILNELTTGSREEIISIFQSLLSRYPQLVGTNYQEEISLFLSDALATHTTHGFKPNEIKKWWKENESQNDNQ
ncbi:MAG: hypothetical protein OJF59_001826 [Cytophagales bacterium]|jgi:hypothetical protein|nr:hypothetical protein [Bacteroidota bacterium]MBS1950704.1 hypothetical protein [Bacteroidota bacterium]MBS1980736.1 hypothetical protein [Bacteroidota bacterium]WHZ08073.1 MAG: hypothetical protein OJF59_001826 [Cytophagales bacterium]